MKRYKSKHPDQVVRRVIELHEEWYSQRDTVQKISDELWYDISKTSVYRILRNIWSVENLDAQKKERKKEKEGDDDVLAEITESKNNIYSYVFDERTQQYIGQVDKVPVLISREKVNSAFFSFARTGENKDSMTVMYENNLDDIDWSFLQWSLHLRKNWPNVWPYDREEANKEGKLDELAETMAKKWITNKYQHEVIKRQQRLFKWDANKAIRVLTSFEDKVKHIKDIMWNTYCEPTTKDKNKFMCWDVWYFVIADLHAGWWSIKETEKLIDNIAIDIIDSPYDKIFIDINGDMFETSVLWWMHDWQVEDMAIHQGIKNPLFRMELIMFTKQLIADRLLRKIHDSGKKLFIKARWWNHGRWDKKSENDPNGLVELMMYDCIRERLKDTDILFEYASWLVDVYDIDNMMGKKKVRFVVFHWHIRWQSQKPQNLVNMYSKWADFVVLIQSHFHNPKQSNISTIKYRDHIEYGINRMKVITPALCPANTYALEKLVVDSPTWYLSLENNRYGKFTMSHIITW